MLIYSRWGSLRYAEWNRLREDAVCCADVAVGFDVDVSVRSERRGRFGEGGKRGAYMDCALACNGCLHGGRGGLMVMGFRV